MLGTESYVLTFSVSLLFASVVSLAAAILISDSSVTDAAGMLIFDSSITGAAGMTIFDSSSEGGCPFFYFLVMFPISDALCAGDPT